MDIATTEPLTVTAGDRIKWKKFFTDYKPEDSWVLTYALINSSGKEEITATDNSDSYHLVDVLPDDSGVWASGEYRWNAYVTKSTERYLVDDGLITINPNFSKLDTYDSRSHVKKVLDALDALIEGKASKDQLTYSISTPGGASRSLTRLNLSEAIQARRTYYGMYKRELARERVRNGKSAGNKVKVRF